MGPQQARGQHRAQRQRGDRRQQHGNRQSEAEFAEQPAGLAGQERQRDEHGRQRRGGGQHGEEHLFGPQNGGGAGAHPLGPAADDVFQHDDGIVDDKASGQNQRQQGHDVDGKPDQPDGRQRAHQRHRHRNDRDQRGADIAQEDVDHRRHDQHRQAKRNLDFVDGAFDEIGTVRGDVHVDIVRQQRLQVVHHLSHGLGYGEGVAIGLADDAQPDAGLTVRPQDRRAGFGPKGDLRHVAQPHIAGDSQRFDLFGRADGGGGAHLQALPVRTQRAGGAVKGRIAKHVPQVGQGQAPCRQLHQVDIDPEGQFPVAEDLQVGHPGRRQKPAFGKVAHKGRQLVCRPPRRCDSDAQDRLGVGVGLHHPWRVDIVGQVVADPRHRIAQVGCGNVKIDVIAKLYRDPA